MSNLLPAATGALLVDELGQVHPLRGDSATGALHVIDAAAVNASVAFANQSAAQTTSLLTAQQATTDAVATVSALDIFGDKGVRVIVPNTAGQLQQLLINALTGGLHVVEVGEFAGGYFDITTPESIPADPGMSVVPLALYNRTVGEGGSGKNLRVISVIAEYHYKAAYNGIFVSGWFRFTGRPTGGTPQVPVGRKSEVWDTAEASTTPTGGYVLGSPILARWPAGTNISGGLSQADLNTQPPVAYHQLAPGQGMLLRCEPATANLLIDAHMLILQE